MAQRWQPPVGTLADWASGGTGPRYAVFGNHARYRLLDVIASEDEQLAKQKTRDFQHHYGHQSEYHSRRGQHQLPSAAEVAAMSDEDTEGAGEFACAVPPNVRACAGKVTAARRYARSDRYVRLIINRPAPWCWPMNQRSVSASRLHASGRLIVTGPTIAGRSSLRIGQRGSISRKYLGGGVWEAQCRYRDADGVTRRVRRRGPADEHDRHGKLAEDLLVEIAGRRRPPTGAGEIGPDTSVMTLVQAHLDRARRGWPALQHAGDLQGGGGQAASQARRRAGRRGHTSRASTRRYGR